MNSEDLLPNIKTTLLNQLEIISRNMMFLRKFATLLTLSVCSLFATECNEELFNLISQGKTASAQEIIAQGVDVNCSNQYGQTLLILAAGSGSLPLVRQLVEAGADIELRDKWNISPLAKAANESYVEIMEYLQANGAVLDTSDSNLKKALLRQFTFYGTYETAAYLFEKGVRIDPNKYKVLVDVVRGGYEEYRVLNTRVQQEFPKQKMLQLLLDNCVQANSCDVYKNIALATAAAFGDTTTAALLLSAGADINAVSGRRGPLNSAIAENELEMVQFLVEQGADITVRDTKGSSSMFLAIEKNRPEILEYLYSQGGTFVDADTNYLGRRPLESAISRGFTEVVEVLLKQGEDPNEPIQYGTLLGKAVKGQHSEITKLLCQNGAKISTGKDSELIKAVRNVNVEIVKILVEHSDDLSVKTKWYKNEQALHWAIGYKYNDLARMLIEKGHDLNEAGYRGHTALTYSFSMQNKEVVDLLLANDVDINVRGAEDKTPLVFATMYFNFEYVDTLLNRGADVSIKDASGATALHYASLYWGANEISKLIEHGADPAVKDNSGNNSLDRALSVFNVKAARALLERGNSNLSSKTTDLLRATLLGDHDEMQRLIDDGVDVNEQDSQGRTALMAAQDRKSVSLLLNEGADVTVLDSMQNTPLVYASRYATRRAVKMLIKKGAPVNSVEGKYQPIHSATRASRPDIMKLLLKNGADVNALASQKPLAGANALPLFTALMEALFNTMIPFEDKAKILLDYGANISQSNQSVTVISMAALRGNIDAVDFLLKNGAELREVQENLSIIAQFSSSEMIAFILGKGIDINSIDKNGETLLMGAAKGGRFYLVQQLLEQGADPLLENSKGKTAGSLAYDYSKRAIGSILKTAENKAKYSQK